MVPFIVQEECTGCGLCTEVCPAQALSLEGGHLLLEDAFCEECGLCASNCPNHAIRIDFPMLAKRPA